MVPGVKQMVNDIYDNHKGFSVVINYLLTYALLQLTAYVALILAYSRGKLSGISLLFLVLIVLLNPVTAFVAANGFGRNSYLNVVMVAGLGLAAYYQNPVHSGRVNIGGVRLDLCLPSAWMDKGALQ